MSFRSDPCRWEHVVKDPYSLTRHQEFSSLVTNNKISTRLSDIRQSVGKFTFAREALSKSFVDYLRSFEAPRICMENAEKLLKTDSAIVITGQQPGFLGGPLYTFFKAAHTIVLARTLEEQWSTPVIPCFWNHSDDHDIDETRGVAAFDSALETHRFHVDLGRGRPFLSDVRYPESAEDVWKQFEALLPAGLDRERICTLFRPRGGSLFAQETTRLLLELFGRFGLVVFEPYTIRRELSQVLATLVRDVHLYIRALRDISGTIRAAGFKAAFDENDPSILFVKTPAGRERVHYDGEFFILPGNQKLRPADLADQILSHPLDYTAGVAVRLVCESLALPVVASIRGPAEIAYSPCSMAFWPRSVDRIAPIEVPRFSATLLNEKSSRWMQSVQPTVSELFGGATAGQTNTTRITLPLESELSAVEQSVITALQRLQPSISEVDSNLTRPFEKTLSTVQNSLELLRSKLTKTLDDRADTRGVQLRKLQNFVAPYEKPHERVFSIAPYLCNGIDAFTSSLLESIAPFPTDHRLLYV